MTKPAQRFGCRGLYHYATGLAATIDPLTAIIQATVDAIALVIQAPIDAMTLVVEMAIDTIAFVIQAPRKLILAQGLRPVRPPIQPPVDAVTLVVEPILDAITPLIQVFFHPITTMVEARLDPVSLVGRSDPGQHQAGDAGKRQYRPVFHDPAPCFCVTCQGYNAIAGERLTGGSRNPGFIVKWLPVRQRTAYLASSPVLHPAR
jgi:hypothetical protein